MKRFTRMICTALALLLIVSSTAVGAKASGDIFSTHIGTVNASSLRLRSQPSTSSATLDYAPRGDYAVVVGKTGAWYQVIYNLQTGYMHESYLQTNAVKNIELGYGKVNASKVNLRTGPSTSYSSIGKANLGDKAYIIGLNNKWYKIIYGSSICYIRSDYLDLTEIPYENAASAKKPLFFVDGKSTGVTPSASALSGTSKSNIVAEAKKYIGTPYVWGGTTTAGFDCSGYTQYVMKRCGITLPRTTTEQYKIGTYVSKANLQPGDLVFLQNTYREGISHVGIYIGEGKMIHASSSKGVVISDLSSSYYVQHYYGARRIS